MAYFVYAGIMRQPILWDTHTVVTNVEVAKYWVIVLYLMGSVILDSVKLHPPSTVFNVGFCLFCVKVRICDQHCKYFLTTPF